MEDEPRPGAEIGGYRLETELGRGGMGTVFLATRLADGRRAALKIPKAELMTDESFQQRFEREAAYAASIAHPAIIEVLDAGEDEGMPFMAMRYVPGSDLKEVLARRAPLDPVRSLDVLRQVAGALDAAHAAGLLHRDVKPGNVMIASGEGEDPAGQAFITDFGLAKNPRADTIALTRAGHFVGTVEYVAPEQILAQEFDHRVDVYALGCVLFECLSGHLPFERKHEIDVIYAHLQDPPPRLTELRPELPAALDAVIAKALEKEADERFATCSELIAAAERALGFHPKPTVIVSASNSSADLAAGGRLVLEVLGGDAQGTLITIGDALEIGREADGPGRLGGDPELSRHHARISRGPSGELVIEDLGSTNGTAVNGELIARPRPIGQGDRIGVGRSLLQVRPAAKAEGVEVPSQAPSPTAVEPETLSAVHPGPAPAPPAPAPLAAAPPAPAPPAAAPPAPEPLALELELYPPPLEIVLRISGCPDVRLVREGDQWRVADNGA